MQSLKQTEENWTWLTKFEVKFVQGIKFASGSFRDAFQIRVTEYGELPKVQYVLKLWNARTVDSRKEERHDECSDEEITEELSKRVIVERSRVIYFKKIEF